MITGILITETEEYIAARAFESAYISITEDFEKLNEEYSKINILANIYQTQSSEGFTDTVKRMGITLLEHIIKFFKMLVELIDRFIKWIINIIKNKAYLNIINFMNKINNTDFSTAYDKYGDTNILDSTIEGIPQLREATMRDIYSMRYDSSCFREELLRLSVTAFSAVESIRDILETTLKENVWLRTGNALYGETEEENNVLKGNGFLEFYNERNFQEFIYKLNRLTHGSINKLIVDQRNERGKGIYLNFDTNEFPGDVVARAAILNKTLDEAANTQQTRIHKIDGNIKIRDIISKELLIKIRNKDRNIITQIENDASSALKSCEVIKKLSINYYTALENKTKELKREGKVINENYVRPLAKSQQYMKFMVEFSQYLFNYRLNTLDIARRATLILCKKANISFDGVNNKTSSFTFSLSDRSQFEESRRPALYALCKRCLIKQTNKLGRIDIPLYLLLVSGKKVSTKGEDKIELGHCLGLYSGVDDNLIRVIMNKCITHSSDGIYTNNLIKQYDKKVDNGEYSSPDRQCKLVGIVIRIYVDDIVEYICKSGKYVEPDKYLMAYFLGNIIHEVTHAKQIYDIEKTLKEAHDMRMDNNEAVFEENNNKRNANFSEMVADKKKTRKEKDDELKNIKKIHEKFNYSLTGYEQEANKEEIEFIMHIIDIFCKDNEIKKDIEDNLRLK